MTFTANKDKEKARMCKLKTIQIWKICLYRQFINISLIIYSESSKL